MENQKINYEKSLLQARRAYNSGHECITPYIKNLLEEIFGKENLNVPVTERIKTFEDACRELGDNHPYVEQYVMIERAYHGEKDISDLIAYLKLRIIAAALNEGWEPQFTREEYRYYPWFYLYTQKEIDQMSEEEKGRVVGRSVSSADANGGLAYAFANSASSGSYTSFGARLAFRTSELARYAGLQFADIWADYVFKAKSVSVNEPQK